MIEFVNVSKQFREGKWRGRKNNVQAVRNVSLQIKQGTCFALVGESGSGKSTLGKLLIGLEKPDQGRVLFQGCNLHEAGREERQRLRRDMQIVFQDPYSAVNPRMKIRDVIAEPMRVHFQYSAAEINEKVKQLLEAVGLDEKAGEQYSHQFSGGQLQRITIARAISIGPKVIVLDEVINSLDVLVQISILKLLKRLQQELNLTYLFISHDLHAVKWFADEVAVLDKGEVVDFAHHVKDFDQLTHPASRRLIEAQLPIVTQQAKEEYPVKKGLYVS
ncbi:dipeptide/oligopeptide/nickel ABC transporter ATP-binding protein [Paenibacillus alkaliterrae]|uniref:ABC transporter ATP-binding protein n=1 Tax=Paenibacillus alkaliterrae TaxID=320909 RepID=UPI001F374251|nr:dipeptide/oligopeptide/nickel ABC transporter ATP-binding protein [Paenibacillus alkaliterrae]MCF2939491.1 dipeptide/oligopeptide/nickel ABC transporter ATP-binding protein [Paenibacillus alkaliterrae]